MIRFIQKRVENEGHFVVYLKMNKAEFTRLSEVLARENINTKIIIDDFVIFYNGWLSNTSVNKIIERTIRMLKRIKPELFDDEWWNIS